jgi:hypothetical protein
MFMESVQFIGQQLKAICNAPRKSEVEDTILLHLYLSFEPNQLSFIAGERNLFFWWSSIQFTFVASGQGEDMGSDSLATQRGGGRVHLYVMDVSCRIGKVFASMFGSLSCCHPGYCGGEYHGLQVENFALISFSGMGVVKFISSPVILDSGSAGSVGGVRGKGVQVVSSGRKSHVRSRRKVVRSQPEYVF